ncbi:MAG TPA: DUF365 domain-containing protein [Methanomicrobiales archaeon]|nr:DUF365 domain-containing protein [Methanomicrobiales archaeon]
MSTITGVIYPIPKAYISRFFKGKKTVFVKPATTYRHLRAGMRFVFYQSTEEPGCIGEARIKRIFVSEDPLQFLDTYGDRVFLDSEELISYKESRKKRSGSADEEGLRLWIAIELEGITVYKKPVRPARPVPPGGEYLRE